MLLTRTASVLLLCTVPHTWASPAVQKVIDLLVKLKLQVEDEGKAEAISYNKYSCFCKHQADDKNYAIKKSDERITGWDTEIAALEADANALLLDVTSLRTDLTAEEGKAEDREPERKEYEEERIKLVGNINAVDDALEQFRLSKANVEAVRTGKSLIQKYSSFLTADSDRQKPKNYQSKSKGVEETLVQLQSTFKEKLKGLDEDEHRARSQHSMTEGARLNKIKAIKHKITKKEQLAAEKEAEKSKLGQKLEEEKTSKQADDDFLKELLTKCEAKAKAWDARSETRNNEIGMLGEAITKLGEVGGKKATGLVTKSRRLVIAQRHIQPHSEKIVNASTVVQKEHGRTASGKANRTSSAASFLQLATVKNLNRIYADAARQLENRAKGLNSGTLALVADELRSGDSPDHFAKVRGLINDLITKLEAQAEGEATEKTACDKSMGDAKKEIEKQQAGLEKFSSLVARTEADIKISKTELKDLRKEHTQLTEDLAKMQKIRKEEKEANEKALKSNTEAKAAVDSALRLMSDFYSTVQLKISRASADPPKADRDGKTVSDSEPETFKGDYKGQTDKGKGIIDILEVIAAGFERAAKEAESAESEASGAFADEERSAKGLIDDKDGSIRTTEESITNDEAALTGHEDDVESTKKLLKSAEEELDLVKQSCVDNGETYAQRKQKREQEIENLQYALKILEANS